MSRILITGGAGFIGFHLAGTLLARGHEIDLIDDFSRAVVDPGLEALLARPGVRCLQIDLREASALDSLPVDYARIFHLAAIIGVTHVLSRPYAVLADNVAMLDHVIGLARRQRALDRLVFASTSEVYAGSLIHFDLPVPTPETAPIALPALDHPRTSYMLSKLYGEAMCLQSGLPVTIVRPHNFYGPRMGLSHVIPELLAKVHRMSDGETLPVASAHHRRAFCHIDDAVAMMAALSEAEAARGGTFNLGNQDQEIAIGELAALLVRLVGRRLALAPAEAHPGSPSRRCPDMARTIAVTGFRPAISLEEGAARTYRWYRTHVFDNNGVSAR